MAEPKKWWVVVDPKPTSTLADLVWETTAAGFGRACVGGPTLEENPEIHATREEALDDLDRRLKGACDHLDSLRIEIDAEGDAE